MAESSLSVGRPELRREVGRFLGIGRNPDNWSADEVTDVDDLINAGLRNFYFPEVNGETYEWSFLRPITTLTTVAGTSAYDLPDDYGAHFGRLTYPAGSSTFYPPIPIISEEMLRSRAANLSTSSHPKVAAVRPKAYDATTGQRWEILFWPTPNAAYTLSYRYQANPSALSDSLPYALGGMKHAETILESCLAVAESRMDDAVTTQHQARFKSCLAMSVAQDRRNHTGEYYGQPADADPGEYYHNHGSLLVSTYNGQTPLGEH